jgi:hypothetical protein
VSRDASASVDRRKAKKNVTELATGASLHIPARGESKGKMPELFERLDNKKNKELRVLSDFISIFCRENHRTEIKKVFPIKDTRLHLDLMINYL